MDAFVAKNSTVVSATQTGALIAHVGPDLHNCVVLVMKWCETHPNMSFGQTGALTAHVGPVMHNCIVIVTKWCETHPNMSFGSNGVDWMC